jgi:hypothetical protein
LRRIVVVTFILLLPGCLLVNHKGTNIGELREISVNHEMVCYSLNKNDVLTSYYLESNEMPNKIILASDIRRPVKYYYPNTCLKIKLIAGYQYSTLYTLNNSTYHYEFFIDNNWNVVNLSRR